MNATKTWLVTGASKGLGLALVKRLLSEGHNVVATSRDRNALQEEIGHSDRFLPLSVDILNENSVQTAISSTIDRFGRLDVVVNNAGYGLLGTIEELSDAESRQNFDVNVFGSLNVIRAAMPQLRAQRSGAIFNISSVGGFMGNFPGWGIYCATKFAVAGFTESLAAEVAEFGISATVVYPGYFRTNFLDSGSLVTPKQPIADYTKAREVEAFHHDQMKGNQAGDPDKAASVLIEMAGRKDVPLHLFLGQDAHDMAQAKIDSVQQDIASTRDLATATAF